MCTSHTRERHLTLHDVLFQERYVITVCLLHSCKTVHLVMSPFGWQATVWKCCGNFLHCDTVQNTNSCNSHLKQSWSIYFRSILEELLTVIKKILKKLCLTSNFLSFHFLLTSEQPTYRTHLYKIQYQLQPIITNSSTLLSNIKLFYLFNNTLVSTGGLGITRCGYYFFGYSDCSHFHWETYLCSKAILNSTFK